MVTQAAKARAKMGLGHRHPREQTARRHIKAKMVMAVSYDMAWVGLLVDEREGSGGRMGRGIKGVMSSERGACSLM